MIKTRTKSQAYYVECIEEGPLTFGIGPAGTGKTYLAIACAIAALKLKQVERLVITRPAVEAGENLGFLPGSLAEKVGPYLRPIYDAITEVWPQCKIEDLVADDKLEIAPLAYMRGRSLKRSFIVLDEAQNTTTEQMRMFLTRVDKGSNVVVTGDPSQIDLPAYRNSGLVEAMAALRDVEEASFCTFSPEDIQRHKLVRSIVRAYEKFDRKEAQ